MKENEGKGGTCATDNAYEDASVLGFQVLHFSVEE
jgi:hypothetical protein